MEPRSYVPSRTRAAAAAARSRRTGPRHGARAGAVARADAARAACARARADDPGAARRASSALPKSSVHGLCTHAGLVRLPAAPGRRCVPDRPARDGPGRGLRRRHRRRPGVQRAVGRQRRRARGDRGALGARAAATRSTSPCATAPGRSASPSTSACGCRRTCRAAARRCSSQLSPDEVRSLLRRRPAGAPDAARGRATSRRCSRSWR